MEYIVVGILFLLVIILGIIIKNQSDKINQLNTTNLEQIKQHYTDEYKAAERGFEKDYQALSKSYAQKSDYINNQLDNLAKLLKGKEEHYNEVNQDLDLYKKGKIKEIDGAAAEYEQRRRIEIEQALKQRELQANSDFNNQVDGYIAQKTQMQTEIDQIKAELEVERSKRAAINEEIRRQREVEEQTDFYRIQLDPNDLDDIEILRNTAPRLRHPEAINKIIWTNYYQKPLAELRKRVAIEGPGVYKITRLKTGEIYIGQAVNVSTRWAEHVKSALGVGTLASSQLHRVMAEDGPEQFTFELLEEVPKEKLRERESYYIDFYDSKTYGLNTISGDKK